MRVAITGISGFVGQAMLERLEECERVERVVGIDLKGLSYPAKKLKHYRMDIRDPRLEGVFRENGVDTVVHLAFILNPPPSSSFQREVNVGGSENVLRAASRCGVRKFVFASSTTVYGAHPDNPEWLREGDPLRPNIQYAREKSEVEERCQRLSNRMMITILRLSTVVGPHIDNPVIAYVLAAKHGVAFKVGPFPTIPLQLVHEDDVVEAFYRATVEEHPGVFNVAGDGVVDENYVRARRLKLLEVPVPVVKRLLDAGRRLGMHFWEPTLLNYLIYRWAASNELIKRRWGFRFRYSTTEALEDTGRRVGLSRVAPCLLPYMYFLGRRLR